jgi:hypothetical protein
MRPLLLRPAWAGSFFNSERTEAFAVMSLLSTFV